MGDYSGEQKKPLLFGSAASVLHKCVYRKNIKSTMGNSLPCPTLINFSTCWQISTWTGMEFERWMCKSTAGGKLNLSGPAAVPCISYSFWLSQSSICHWAGLLGLCHPRPGEPQCGLCLLTAQGPGWNSKQQEWRPRRYLQELTEPSSAFLCAAFGTSLPRHLQSGGCILWAPLQHLPTW